MCFSPKITLFAGTSLAVACLIFFRSTAHRDLPAAPPAADLRASSPDASTPAVPAAPAASPSHDEKERQRICGLAALNPRSAADEAARLPDASLRKTILEDIMALWLHKDRLEAAEWLLSHPSLPEFDFLSAQTSHAFFPDDTEMASMFAFDIRDEKLRTPLVNDLVAYWRTGAHLKFDEGAGAANTDSP